MSCVSNTGSIRPSIRCLVPLTRLRVFPQDEKEFYSAFYPHLFHFQPDAARQRRFEGPSHAGVQVWVNSFKTGTGACFDF